MKNLEKSAMSTAKKNGCELPTEQQQTEADIHGIPVFLLFTISAIAALVNIWLACKDCPPLTMSREGSSSCGYNPVALTVIVSVLGSGILATAYHCLKAGVEGELRHVHASSDILDVFVGLEGVREEELRQVRPMPSGSDDYFEPWDRNTAWRPCRKRWHRVVSMAPVLLNTIRVALVTMGFRSFLPYPKMRCLTVDLAPSNTVSQILATWRSASNLVTRLSFSAAFCGDHFNDLPLHRAMASVRRRRHRSARDAHPNAPRP